MPHALRLSAISGVRLVTADAGAATAFYGALGFRIGEKTAIPPSEMTLLGLSGSGTRIPMTLGSARVDLDCFDRPGRPYPTEASSNDAVFQHLALITDDARAAWDLARAAGAIAIGHDGPVTLPASSGGVTAVKFRDPEGHPLEFLQFPPGANPDWTGTGIMGLDHSAISVADVAASRAFYTAHGLSEGAATVNTGPAQDALDGLAGVTVDVVPMKAATAPPHLELLGYRHPPGRVARPRDANDVAATRIVWRGNEAALLRDPDGHLQQVSR